MLSLKINGKTINVDVEPDTPLLWVLRDTIGLTGTKFGCGAGLCGACSVHIDGKLARSCSVAVSAVGAQEVVTIEHLAANARHPVITAWIEAQVPQCGYCQSGQIMAATALLNRKANPTDNDINAEMTNICRCGTYAEIRNAIRKAATLMSQG